MSKKIREQQGMAYEIEYDGKPTTHGWTANEFDVFEAAAKVVVRQAQTAKERKKQPKSIQIRVWPASLVSTKKGKKQWTCSLTPEPSWKELHPGIGLWSDHAKDFPC